MSVSFGPVSFPDLKMFVQFILIELMDGSLITSKLISETDLQAEVDQRGTHNSSLLVCDVSFPVDLWLVWEAKHERSMKC